MVERKTVLPARRRPRLGHLVGPGLRPPEKGRRTRAAATNSGAEHRSHLGPGSPGASRESRRPAGVPGSPRGDGILTWLGEGPGDGPEAPDLGGRSSLEGIALWWKGSGLRPASARSPRGRVAVSRDERHPPRSPAAAGTPRPHGAADRVRLSPDRSRRGRGLPSRDGGRSSTRPSTSRIRRRDEPSVCPRSRRGCGHRAPRVSDPSSTGSGDTRRNWSEMPGAGAAISPTPMSMSWEGHRTVGRASRRGATGPDPPSTTMVITSCSFLHCRIGCTSPSPSRCRWCR
jgi:hypothetical protein